MGINLLGIFFHYFSPLLVNISHLMMIWWLQLIRYSLLYINILYFFH